MNAGPIKSDESQVDPAYNRANEKAIVLVLAGLLVGSMAMLAWEWIAWRFDLVATVPRSRQQRFLITSHLGLWFTLCGLMIAWLFSMRRYDRPALRLPEHLGVYVGPGTWWRGLLPFSACREVRSSSSRWPLPRSFSSASGRGSVSCPVSPGTA